MPNLAQIKLPSPVRLAISSISGKPALMVLSVLILAPLAAHAQGSPFDTGFNAIQGLFTGTIAKVASLVAIVIGGYGFAQSTRLQGAGALVDRELSTGNPFGVVVRATNSHRIPGPCFQ